MSYVPNPRLLMSSLIGQYQERSGHVVTEGTVSFPLKAGDNVANNPILNLDVDMDFKTRAALTLDLGPTNPTKDFSTLPTYTYTQAPIYIDPGWLSVTLAGGDLSDQVTWGGKLMLKHIIIRCELGAVSLHVGGIDPFGDYPANPPAKTRPFIMQEGGVFAQSFKGTRPFTVTIAPDTGPNDARPFVQGIPNILLQTFEDLNRIRLIAFIEHYN